MRNGTDFIVEQAATNELEGKFRYAHSRLLTHAESVAFFGGGLREADVVNKAFTKLQNHSRATSTRVFWGDIVEEYFSKQFIFSIMWALGLMFSLTFKRENSIFR